MFECTTMQILSETFTVLDTLQCDLQPIRQTIALEDQIELEVTARVFCAPNGLISTAGYLLCAEQLYKILRISPWDDYWELWLYACERSLP